MGWKELLFGDTSSRSATPKAPISDGFEIKGFDVAARPDEFGQAITDWSFSGVKGLVESFSKIRAQAEPEAEVLHAIATKKIAVYGGFVPLTGAVFLFVTRTLNRQMPEDVMKRVGSGMATFLYHEGSKRLGMAPDEDWCRAAAYRAFVLADRMIAGKANSTFDAVVHGSAREIISGIVQGTGPKRDRSEPAGIDPAVTTLEVYVSDMARHVTKNLAPRFVP